MTFIGNIKAQVNLMNNVICLLILPLLLFHAAAFADNYYGRHSQGWHWYHEPQAIKQHKKPKPISSPVSSNPLAELKQLQRQVEVTKAQAILHPTINNVRHYIALQHQLSTKASNFSRTWAHVLRLYPTLDDNLIHPMQQMARHQYLDNQGKQRKSLIRKLTDGEL